MLVAVPREVAPGERRVALVPSIAGRLVERGLEVGLEAGAGAGAGYRDRDYEAKGARIEASGDTLLAGADVVLKVRPPQVLPDGRHEVDRFREGGVLISFLFPHANLDSVRRLRDRRVAAFAMDLMPRITRAQAMDALSSMSSISGYKAVIHAANLLPRYFPLLMTAAGTIKPARVLILGAGVAGLQAIGTARRLGALVEAFDIRPVVREQVESLGARFVELSIETKEAETAGGYARAQTEDAQERMRKELVSVIARCDVVITTALVPGKRAPILISADAVRAMQPGSVIIDLAGEQGGNCELAVPGETVVREGVTIESPLNLPSELAVHASDLYAKNVTSFLEHLVRDGNLVLDLDDELTRAPLVTHDGAIVHPPTRESAGES